MIEINLVPENLRKTRRGAAQTKKPLVEGQAGLPQQAIVTILSIFTAFLIGLLIAGQVYIASQISKRNILKQEHALVEQGRKNVEKIIKEMGELKERVKILEKVVGVKTIVWAEKLNEVSDHLPRGVWLTKVALEAKFLVIEGSAVSKTKTEIADIHALTGKLKTSKIFMANLKDLELDMIKTRAVENTSVADFKIKAQLAK